MHEEYATKTARDWNTQDPASGFVGTWFASRRPYVDRFDRHRVGGSGIDELWLPADELAEFNSHIVGAIALTAEYR